MSARASLVNRASMSAQPVSLLCQYNTGILSPGEEGGREGARGREGGRTEEGGGESRRPGEEREQMSVVRGFLWSCPVIEKNVCVWLFFFLARRRAAEGSGGCRGVFTGLQRPTVRVAVPGVNVPQRHGADGSP